MTCFVFSTLKLEISFKMSVLRPSETAWGLRYDLFCVSIIIGALAVSDRNHDHDGGDDVMLILRSFGSILGSCRAQKSSWKLPERFVRAGNSIFPVRPSPFWLVLESFWDGFW